LKIYKLEYKQVLPITQKECWQFFSDPLNLEKITPPEMKFEIKSDLPAAIYPGQIILYRIKLLPGIKISWVTEITHVKDELFFVDEQRTGPYKFWHHQHHFNEVDGGMEIKDIIHYSIPFGILGMAVNKLFVEDKLASVFKYRRDFLSGFFKK